MTPDQLEERLSSYPCYPYVAAATPLELLPNLTRRLSGPQLWLKRDDGIGPGLGGNKARSLSYIMPQVLAAGKRGVVTFGGLQSNHARMTAAACAALGLQAELFFFEPRPMALRGNLMVDQLLGARLHFIPVGGGSGAILTLRQTIRLVKMVTWTWLGPVAYRRSYFMPVGGHNWLGALGYVRAAVELDRQLRERQIDPAGACLILPVGTGATLVGLWVGFTLLNNPIRLVGLDIGRLWRGFARDLARLASRLYARLGMVRSVQAAEVPLAGDRYAGPGYAQPTPEMRQAVELLAQLEGVLLDPVYTGKAFAGLLDLIHREALAEFDHVLFLHTGGLPGLWAGVNRPGRNKEPQSVS